MNKDDRQDDAGDDIVMNDSRCRGLEEFGTKRNAETTKTSTLQSLKRFHVLVKI